MGGTVIATPYITIYIIMRILSRLLVAMALWGTVHTALADPYQASKVVMNVGMWGGTDIYMTKLGVCKDGYQIWVCKGLDSYAYAYWTVDDGSKLSGSTGDFYSNTEYNLSTDYTTGYERCVPEGTGHLHVIKVKAKEQVDYFTYYGSENFYPYSYYLQQNITFRVTQDPYLDEANKCLHAHVQYNLSGVYAAAIDSLHLDMSYDGGNTWNTFNTETASSLFHGDNINNFAGSAAAYIADSATRVRYRVMVYPKADYKILVENGCWTYETEDYPIVIDGATCSISDVSISRNTTTDASAKKTLQAQLSWTAFENLADMLGGVDILCSGDKGKNWTLVGTVTNAGTSGTTTVNIPAGYTKYILRVCPFGKDPFTRVAALRPTADSETLSMTYSPQSTALTVASVSDDLVYEQFRTITLYYTLDTELFLACKQASLAYSYDDGATWQKMKTFAPTAATGSKAILVDGSEKQCKFRILVNVDTDGTLIPYTFETDNVSLSK